MVDIKKQTTLITGAQGFLGSSLVTRLKQVHPKIQLDLVGREVDFENKQQVIECLSQSRPTVIFHMVGRTFTADQRALEKGNIETTRNLLEAVTELELGARVVVPGSAAEYGSQRGSREAFHEDDACNPLSTYGAVKLRQTLLAMDFAQKGIDVVVGRVFNILSPHCSAQSAIGSFLQQIHVIQKQGENQVLKVGLLQSLRDYLWHEDISDGLIALALKARTGQIYNISSGTAVSMEQILRLMISAAQLDPALVLDKNRGNSHDAEYSCGANDKIRCDTQWSPLVSLQDAIKKLLFTGPV